MSRPTPETDAETIYCDAMPNMPWVDADICRKLERERDEAREYAKTLTEKYLEASGNVQRERDEAREERDKLQIMRNEVVAANKGAKINALVSNSLAGKLNKAERERDEAREEIRDWNRLYDAAERGVDLTIAEGTISDLLKQRDEAREALKKCREDSVCYAEHMRKCGYAGAYKESNENADRATRILEETK